MMYQCLATGRLRPWPLFFCNFFEIYLTRSSLNIPQDSQDLPLIVFRSVRFGITLINTKISILDRHKILFLQFYIRAFFFRNHTSVTKKFLRIVQCLYPFLEQEGTFIKLIQGSFVDQVPTQKLSPGGSSLVSLAINFSGEGGFLFAPQKTQSS